MTRAKKKGLSTPTANTDQAGAVVLSPCVNSIVEALRETQAQRGPGYSRAQMIDTIASCIRYSIELDGSDVTIALLAQAVMMLQGGMGDVVAARTATHH